MVLDVVVGATRKVQCNLRPFISILIMTAEQNVFFCSRPLLVVDVGIQLVVPSLTTLFSCTAVEIVLGFHAACDGTPFFDLSNLNDLQKHPVFLNEMIMYV